jgi:aminopeptidase-like protein
VELTAAPISLGAEMHALVSDLYPICRSITGDGFRATLSHLQKLLPLEVHEVPTGTRAFDWTVPNEWNIREAWIQNSAGERIVDFHSHNLHVVNYSIPVRKRMSLSELRPHLFSLPEHPDWIPYRTSYYRPTWGFCLAHRQLQAMAEDEYEVCIDSTLAPGHLTWGELLLPGESSDEVLLSCHSCHPSLANDNLAGMAVATYLARQLAAQPRRLSYRFLFIPGTIGSITWLSQNRTGVGRIKHGLVLSCLGDRGSMTYKRSRGGNALIDRAASHVLRHSGDHNLLDFVPYGYDERQYCSPGFDLAVGCLTRTPNGKYAEYHTSADNLDFVSPEHLAHSLCACEAILDVLEHDARYRNLNPYCEPQLGKRGLYDGVAGKRELPALELALLWVLNQSDGDHGLLEIAERSGLEFHVIHTAAAALTKSGLLEPVARAGRIS